MSSSGRAYLIGDGDQPAGGAQGQTAVAAMASAETWHYQRSPCTKDDVTYVPLFTYLGTDDREGDFEDAPDGNTTCSDPDAASTIDAGNLDPSNSVAITCWWLRSQPGKDTVRTADIRLNTADKDFTYAPSSNSCFGDFDVQSILTHEMGHVLGLDDNRARRAKYQTMSGSGSGCTSFMRTLGEGDVKGLLVHY